MLNSTKNDQKLALLNSIIFDPSRVPMYKIAAEKLKDGEQCQKSTKLGIAEQQFFGTVVLLLISDEVQHYRGNIKES